VSCLHSPNRLSFSVELVSAFTLTDVYKMDMVYSSIDKDRWLYSNLVLNQTFATCIC
jgi:hypothetical protein